MISETSEVHDCGSFLFVGGSDCQSDLRRATRCAGLHFVGLGSPDPSRDAGRETSVQQDVYFPNDNLFAINRPGGLPIGNLTSQFWANCYLNPFDHFVKRELQCKGYIRYVDDFLLFSNDRNELMEWRAAIIKRLASLRVTLHENKAQALPVAEGIPFLGFTVFPTHRKLKRRRGIAFQRKYQIMLQEHAAGKISRDQITAAVQGWVNHVRYANTWGLRRALFTDN